MATDREKPTLGSDNANGRVVVDGRGRNVWQWNDARVDIDSTTILLKRLENDSLELEATQNRPVAEAAEPEPGKKRRRSSKQTNELTLSESMRIEMASGFDPYNRS